ncbi:MAG: hypothetical protein D6732_26285 [Methanobacteriota archaeon]|nr:MAG: hypothetical protein D6732_26285 [Euryarchaeota archaeon]
MVGLADLMEEVVSLYDNLETHSSFQIRARIFQGGGRYGEGMVVMRPVLVRVRELLSNLSDAQERYFGDDVKRAIQELRDTLDMMVNNHSMLSADDLIKLKDVFRVELENLQEKLEKVLSVSDDEIPTEEEIHEDELSTLRGKIWDSFRALEGSYLWREMLQHEGTDVNVLFEVRDQIRSNIQKITDENTLRFFASFSSELRNLLSADFAETSQLFNYFLFLTDLLSEVREWPLSKPDPGNPHKTVVTSEDVLMDLETKLARGLTQWLIYLFEDLEENTPLQDLGNVFVNELYRLSRDPMEFFMWTMSQLAYRKKDEGLMDLSETYATLASALLSLIYDLENYGHSDLASQILNFNAINPSSAIDDITELYDPRNINSEMLKKAIVRNIRELADLALDISALDELSETIHRVFEFTVLDRNFEDIDEVRSYLHQLRDLSDH